MWPFRPKPGPGRCQVYFRPEATFAVTQLCAGGSLWIVGEPFLELPVDAAPETLGHAVLKSLKASKVVPGSALSTKSSFGIRFPDWEDFREENRGVLVERLEGKLTAIPCSNTPEGFTPLADLGLPAATEARALGEAILQAREQAVVVTVPPPSAELERPRAFGSKCRWWAVPARDAQALAQALALRGVVPCSWRDGLARAQEGHGIFVSPPVRGWCLAVGDVPEPTEEAAHDPALLQLGDLSQKFGDAQLYCAHRGSDVYCWARAREGSIERAFAASPGDVDWRMGKATPAEAGFRFFDPTDSEAATDAYWDRKDLEHPGEEHVLAMARSWSLDPTTLGDVEEAGVGLWGRP